MCWWRRLDLFTTETLSRKTQKKYTHINKKDRQLTNLESAQKIQQYCRENELNDLKRNGDWVALTSDSGYSPRIFRFKYFL